MGPKALAQVLCQLPKFESDKLLVGLETSDDAAVYKLNDNQALIQTLDFFTPIVDDPYVFGKIAAANALSDVYAMGGTPIIALNIVAFPNCLDVSVLTQILQGGADKVKEAGALLAGGHTIQDDEPKYGLSVSGLVHPDKVRVNCSAREGDIIILTKPIGVGILNTAIKNNKIEEKEQNVAIQSMTTLNKYAAEAMERYDISACTDITGFGLAGHALEMARGSNLTLEIKRDSVPIIEGVMKYASQKIVPGGAYKNQQYNGEYIVYDNEMVSHDIFDIIIHDPQTSGGLLIAVSEKDAENCLNDIKNANPMGAYIIGKVVKKRDRFIHIV